MKGSGFKPMTPMF